MPIRIDHLLPEDHQHRRGKRARRKGISAGRGKNKEKIYIYPILKNENDLFKMMSDNLFYDIKIYQFMGVNETRFLTLREYDTRKIEGLLLRTERLNPGLEFYNAMSHLFNGTKLIQKNENDKDTHKIIENFKKNLVDYFSDKSNKIFKKRYIKSINEMCIILGKIHITEVKVITYF